jgi:predicted DNA-binding ribbon-helix-helix protein
MKSTITKRSVVIAGHKTSVSLEEPFWAAVHEITQARAMTVSALLHEIDSNRINANLSSAVRVFVLAHVRQMAVDVHDMAIKAPVEQSEPRGQVGF